MEKVTCALWKGETETREDFNGRILADLPNRLEDSNQGARRWTWASIAPC